MVDAEPVAGGGGDGLQVAGAGADGEVAAAQGSLDHAGTGDIGGAGACRQGAGLPVVDDIDVAAGQQPGKLGLAG